MVALVSSELVCCFEYITSYLDPQKKTNCNFALIVHATHSHSIVDDRFGIGTHLNGIRGMITGSKIIPADTLLIHTPGSLVIGKGEEDPCKKLELLVDEMKLGNQSKWYMQFQYDDGSSTRIPSLWNRYHGAISELQGLPPTGQTHRHADWHQHTCLEGIREPTELEWKALNMYVTRSADVGIVPMYSLLNHHNGQVNTWLERDGEGGLSVFALHDIPPGTPLYLTYARSGLESSVDVFNSYGFIEEYPQLWRWTDDILEKQLQENENLAKGRYLGLDGYSTPNNDQYEVLVISPTLAAILPPQEVTAPLGNNPHTIQEWEEAFEIHHRNLVKSHVDALHDSAKSLLRKLPTTIEEDESVISDGKLHFEEIQKGGKLDDYMTDIMQAIEYRLAFKRALRLAIEVSESEAFVPEKASPDEL